MDTVRRAEHKDLMPEGDETLKNTRQLWLLSPVNFSDEQAADFGRRKWSGLKAARAWAIEELLSKLWNYCYEGSARKFFKHWYGRAARSKLKPVIKVAKMIKRHLEKVVAQFGWDHEWTRKHTTWISAALLRHCRPHSCTFVSIRGSN